MTEWKEEGCTEWMQGTEVDCWLFSRMKNDEEKGSRKNDNKNHLHKVLHCDCLTKKELLKKNNNNKAERHRKHLVHRTGEKRYDYYKHWVAECQQWCRRHNCGACCPLRRTQMLEISQSRYLCEVEVRGNHKRVKNQQRHAEAFLFLSSS